MRLAVLLAFLALGCPPKKPKPFEAPQATAWMQSFSDRACACNNDKACVHAIRDEFETKSRDLFKSRESFTPAEQQAFDAPWQKFRQCGDAAGLTIWAP